MGTRTLTKVASYPSRGKLIAAAILSLLTFALIMTLRATGLLYGFWVLALFGVLLALIPVSKHLSGRILWTLSVVFGFIPLLWWVPLDWPHNSRSSGLLALVAGVVVFCAVWCGSTRGGPRRILPEIRTMDVVPILAAVGGVFISWPGLMVRRVDDAMALLLMAWDNASHFDIFHMQRTHGTVLPLAGLAPDGSRWSFSDYPQGFHSALVMITEMARPESAGGWESDVVNFVNFNAVMNVAIVVLVVAAVCALPALRQSPAVGVPVAVFVGSGWIFGSGALASMHGFSNFLFTTALVVAAIVLCQSMTRVLEPIPLVAVGACTCAVMQNWVLLGILIVPSVLAVLFATPKGRWKTNVKELVIALIVVILVMAAAVTAASQLLTVKAEGILFATGGLPPLDFGRLIVFLGVLGGVTIVMMDRKSRTRDDIRRIGWSISSVWVGLFVALTMAVVQLVNTGTLSYYMQKLSIALSLLVLVGLALAASVYLTRRKSLEGVDQGPGTKAIVGASLMISLVLTQSFGFIFPLNDIGMAPTAESGIQLENQHAALKTGSLAGERILQAVRESSALEGPLMYLTTNQSEVDVILAQQWFDGLRGNYSEHNWNLSLNMFPLSEGAGNLREVVIAIRSQDPNAQFVVDPENREALKQILADMG